MSDRTRSFEITHRELGRLIDEIRKADFRTEEGQNLLMASKQFILSHFNRVSLEHCASLSKVAEKDPQLSRVMKIFSADMQLILQSIKDFFMRYEDAEHSLQYASEYGRIYALLVHSVHKQKTILSMFNRLEGTLPYGETAQAS